MEINTDYLYGIMPNANLIRAKVFEEDSKEWKDTDKWMRFRTIIKDWLYKAIRSQDDYGIMKNYLRVTPFLINRRQVDVGGVDLYEEHYDRAQIETVFRYIEQCTFELMEMVLETTNGVINTKFLQPLACACFIVAFKLIGSYDWITDEDIIYEGISHFADNAIAQTRFTKEQLEQIAEQEYYSGKYREDPSIKQIVKEGVVLNIEKDILRNLEIDILRRTDWKGCPTARISQEDISLRFRKKSKKVKKEHRKTRK